MKQLLLHPQTQTAITAFLSQPAHALVLSGAAGSGKLSLARAVSETVLGLDEDTLDTYAYSTEIAPIDAKAIGIEAVRELEHFLSLRVPSHRDINRIIIIADAHLLTTEAQNALLKTIEEPPAGTLLILTVAQEHSLLPTIRSRTQTVVVKRPELAALQQYFADQGSALNEIKRVLAMSGGLPGLAQALLNDGEHPLLPAAAMARLLVSQSAFERLTHVDELAQQRPLCLDTLFMMQQIARISLQTASGNLAKRWQLILSATHDANQALSAGAQPRLVLCNLLLRF